MEIKINDNRKADVTVDNIKHGDMFTRSEYPNILYIRIHTDRLEDRSKNDSLVWTLSLKDGHIYGFDKERMVQPIKNITITLE